MKGFCVPVLAAMVMVLGMSLPSSAMILESKIECGEPATVQYFPLSTTPGYGYQSIDTRDLEHVGDETLAMWFCLNEVLNVAPEDRRTLIVDSRIVKEVAVTNDPVQWSDATVRHSVSSYGMDGPVFFATEWPY